MTLDELREVVLGVVRDESAMGAGCFQEGPALRELARRIEVRTHSDLELPALTLWNDLFRQGILAWGSDFMNPGPPHVHLTAKGAGLLENLSRSPSNPRGYMSYLDAKAPISDLVRSYVIEALNAFNECCFRAAAVMIGCAAEALSLELRDAVVARLRTAGKPIQQDLDDWRVRSVVLAVQRELAPCKREMPKDLREAYEAYWQAFVEQIRRTRNDAGHPAPLDPITEQVVQASFLVFPELAALSGALRQWALVNLE